MKVLIALILLFLVTSCSQAVTLAWDANEPDDFVTQYKVYKMRGSTPELVATTNAQTTNVNVDSFLASGQTKFYVTAVNGAGESLSSNKVSIRKH